MTLTPVWSGPRLSWLHCRETAWQWVRSAPMGFTSLRNETLEGFLERLASTDPAPGGGGSVAVATAMAAALVEMAAGLSTDQVAEAAVIGARAGDIRRRALTLADEDAAAYTR